MLQDTDLLVRHFRQLGLQPLNTVLDDPGACPQPVLAMQRAVFGVAKPLWLPCVGADLMGLQPHAVLWVPRCGGGVARQAGRLSLCSRVLDLCMHWRYPHQAALLHSTLLPPDLEAMHDAKKISTYERNNLQTLCCCGVPGPSGFAEGVIVCAGAGVWCVGRVCVCCVGPCVRQGAMRAACQARLPAQPMGPLCL